MVRLFVQDAVARGQMLVMDHVEVNLFGNRSRTNLGMINSGKVRENFIGVEKIYVAEILQTKLSRTGGAL